ncbi:hypothetical protein PRZ48_003879 [Zasmidium cellare]|uniref:Major facilitator superfamily (MFS) profile domain-containing protein n=1 Tax=Zasmidium cellare TaxID=395010 RepID=A0ABR0EWB0_ZASCE|nr:hypothetical protein PRZ48_003879 [Zasmidium cellare]
MANVEAEENAGKERMTEVSTQSDGFNASSSQEKLEASVRSENASEEPKSNEVVDWDGPSDPENPMNWRKSRKIITLTVVTLMTILSPIASTICSSTQSAILQYFHSSNEALGTLVTSIFLLGYTFGPIAVAPLSEMYGRNIMYQICLLLFIVFNVACAFANSLAMLIVFRLLAGITGSCPVTLGTGTIADLVLAEKRAGPMSAYIVGAVIRPSIGPLIGGYLGAAAGWRWNFWLVAIISGTVSVPAILFVQETYPYVLLQNRTRRLRKASGNTNLRSALDTGKTAPQLFRFSIMRPLKMLLSPIVFLLSVYGAVMYSYLYLCFTTFATVFGGIYGFSDGASGLIPLAFGMGAVIATFAVGATTAPLSKRLTRTKGGEARPECRLPLLIIGGIFPPIGLFWYGWSAQPHVHWIALILGTAVIGMGFTGTYMPSSMYLVDAYPVYAASVTASNTILRSLFGALLPLAGSAMYNSLGVDWGNSLLAFIAMAFLPLPFFFYKYGKSMRKTVWLGVEF